MNHRSKTRLCLCTGGGLLLAAAGAVGLTMMALGAPPSAELAVAASTAGSSAVAVAPQRAQPTLSVQDTLQGEFRSDVADGGVAGPACGGLCPISSFDGIYACITQTCEKFNPGFGSVACGVAGAGTTPNQYARCFDLSVELPLGTVIEIHSVKWGVQQMEHFAGTVGAIPVNINVYTDLACPPSVLTQTLVATATVLIDDPDEGSVFVTPVFVPIIGGQALVGPGGTLVVEVEAPIDGTPLEPIEYAMRPITNADGACTDSFLLAVDCGIADYIAVSAIGFPGSQLVLEVNGQIVGAAKPLCGDLVLQACEECDDGNTLPGDGCDPNCQIEPFCGDGNCDPGEDQCNCPADCGAPPFTEAGLCFDGIDNDCDGFIDCADADCQVGSELGFCADGIDNDCDGLIDCADPDCAVDPVCQRFGACCFKDATCLDAVDIAECEIAFGGTFQGQGTLCATTICPPPNNRCDNRVEIFNGKTPYDNTSATLDGFACVGVYPDTAENMGADLWYNYNATFNGFLTVDTCQGGTLGDTTLAVYDGCVTGLACPPGCLTALALNEDDLTPGCIGPEGFGSSVTIPVVAGQCYKIQVGGFEGDQGTGNVTITKIAPGACCLWDGTCVDNTTAASCAAQGGQFQGDATVCAPAPGGVVCPPPPTGAKMFTDQGAFEQALLNTDKRAKASWNFKPNKLPPGTLVALDDPLNILTHVLDPDSPWFNPPPPNNDLCIDRRPIFNGKTPFDNTASALDGPTCDLNMDTDVWWNYIADFTGKLQVDTCQDVLGALTDTVLTVYDGCDCAGLGCLSDIPPGNELASNDDTVGCGVNNFGSRVSVPVVAGNCYKIQVGGWNGQTGSGTVTISKPPPPPVLNNDLCVDRRPIFNGKTPFTNVGALLDGPLCDASMTGDVWWNYTADFTGNLTVDTCQDAAGTLTDTVLTVYNGCVCAGLGCLPAGNELASDDDTAGCGVVNFGSTVTVPVVAGDCYKIQVGGFLGQTGTGIVTISKPPPPPGGAAGGPALGAFGERRAASSGQGGGVSGGINLWPPSVDNVTFQSNVGPNPQPPLPNPAGVDGLVFANNLFDYDNNILVANLFVDSFDILSGPPAGDNHTAMSLEIVTVPQAGGLLGPVLVTVYDKQEVIVGKLKVDIFQNPPPPPPCSFVVPFPLVRDVPVKFAGDNTGAPNDCGFFPGGHAWEAIILPLDPLATVLNLSYCGSANSTNGGPFTNAWLNLANGCPCTSFTPAGTFAFSCVDGNVEIQWTGLTPGNTYYYPVLLDPPGAIGPYSLTFTAKNEVPPPPCDPGAPGTPVNNCCDARVVIVNGKTPFDSTGATTDGPAAGAPCTGGPGPVNDIWYNYTADFTGDLTVTTCEQKNGSATFDTVIAVYKGCVCPVGASIACNDDDPVNACGGGAGGFHSTVVVPVVAGNCYKIQLGGFSGAASGAGVLSLNKPPPPPGGAAAGRDVSMGEIARVGSDARKPAMGKAGKAAMGKAGKAAMGKAGSGEPTSIQPVAMGRTLADRVGSGSGGIAGGPIKKTFLGIVMNEPLTIGRVNLLDLGGGAEGISKITVYLPSPGVLNTDISGPLGAGFPDGCVDAFDLGTLLGAWCSSASDPDPPGDSDPPCEGCISPNAVLADLSGPDGAPDGCVDPFDLAKLLANWCSVAGGNPCGTCF